MTAAIAQPATRLPRKLVPSQSNSGVQLNRMLLLLRPSDSQAAALDKLLIAQQTPGDPNFHHWVSPTRFSDRFGPSAEDAAKVVVWLQSHGMTVAPVPASRTWLEFSGPLAQVQSAFAARITPNPTASDFSAPARYRLTGNIVLPVEIAPIVAGLVSLDGSEALAAAIPATEIPSPASTQSSGLTPEQLRSAMSLTSKLAEDSSGQGESIVLPSRSTIRSSDFAAFRKTFGIPELPLRAVQAASETNPEIAPETESEASATLLAAAWAGVTAPKAQIVVVSAASTNATDGLDLALATAVDQGLGHTISIGYTTCEQAISSTHQQFYAALYRQAAAEGISIVVAAGDSGAAACHRHTDQTPVSTGYSVNALAATPWNTAIGTLTLPGFTSGKAASVQPLETASGLSYASAGGASLRYATPFWQSAIGLPDGDPGAPLQHHRYLPDLSLPVSTSTEGLIFCSSANTLPAEPQTCQRHLASGSAAASAIFAGISATLAQRFGPQGNLAPNLYALARNTASDPAFIDVSVGSAKLTCLAGTPECDDENRIGFIANPGYDLVSGLGSIKASSLLANWASPLITGTAPVTVEMTTNGSVPYNPSATVVLSAKVLSGSGGNVPTGTVQFYDETTNAKAGTPVTVSMTGTASYAETGQFTNGGHNIVAQYSGDFTYLAATSLPITISIQPGNTTTVLSLSNTSPSGGSAITVTGTVSSSSPGTLPPTGTLAVTLDGTLQGSAVLAAAGGITSGNVSVTIPSAGTHNIQGSYSGDLNYNPSTSPNVQVAVAKAPSAVALVATPATLQVGVLETLTATVAPQTAVAGTTYVLTGSVSFYDGGTAFLGTVQLSNNTAILAGANLSNTVSHTITAVYSGDANYATATSSPLLLASNLLPVTVTLTESASIVAPDQPVTLTATVTPVNTPPSTAEQHPSGYVLFYAGTTLISGQVPILESTGYSSVASTIVPRIAPGQYIITAQYFGDPTYGPGTSNALNLSAEDFTIVSSINNITVQQGNSANVPFTVSLLGGLTGSIQVACEEQNPPTKGAIVCTFSPSVVSSSGIANLNVMTSSGSIVVGQNHKPAGNPLGPVGGVALACVGFLILPLRRYARRLAGNRTRLLIVALLLAGLGGAGLGCTNTVALTNNGNGGTPLGVHTLRITAGAYVNTVTVTHTAYLTVNVTP